MLLLQEMKNRRRTLLAKVKQHRYLAELVNNGNSTSNSATCSSEEESKEKTKSENEKKIKSEDIEQVIVPEKAKTDNDTTETDNNGNIPSLTSQNTVANFPTKKPSHLSLDSNTNDLFLQPVSSGNYHNVSSPLAGLVPSPTNVSSPKSATEPPPISDRCPSIATSNNIAISPLSPNSATMCPGFTRLPTPTNTVKQGKFALLRKYRNSLEEKPKVSVTDVTVGSVTVAIHEGTSPKGFFRDRDGGGSEVFW